MHPFLADPENAKAYQTLCDHPRGSTRAWATKAGWTHSKMVRFLEFLKKEELCRIDPRRPGSLFIPTVPKRSETFRNTDVLDVKSNSNNDVSRYGEAPAKAKQRAPVADPDDIRLIAAANEVLRDRGWQTIDEANYGSIAGARKILKVVPVDRAVPLVESAVRFFNPSATGGESLRSLGHPFITKYVINEFRRTQRDLAGGQLSMLFVERTSPPAPAIGSTMLQTAPVEEKPLAAPETVTAVMADLERVFPRPSRA
jgi:hypothetical protein